MSLGSRKIGITSPRMRESSTTARSVPIRLRSSCRRVNRQNRHRHVQNSPARLDTARASDQKLEILVSIWDCQTSMPKQGERGFHMHHMRFLLGVVLLLLALEPTTYSQTTFASITGS